MRDRPQSRAARVIACAAIALSASACELLSHASDYQISPAAPGLCGECPAGEADLRHPPCAPDGDVTSGGASLTFAARAFHFGHPEDYKGTAAASFALGLDLDCSSRPDGGRPVLCAPNDPSGWTRLPHGIDNAWLTRILSPLYDAARAAGEDFDLDAFATENHDAGKVGFLVTIDGWNGGPDDADVRVALRSSPGVADPDEPPRWDGADVWSTFPDGSAVDERYFEITGAKGYVRGGVLVVDYRAHGAIAFRLATTRGTLKLTVSDVMLVSAITPAALTGFTLSGLADLRATNESVPDFVDMAAPCDGAARSFLIETLPGLVSGAADMPLDPERETCNAISFAIAFDAEPATIGEPREPPPPPDGGCNAASN